MLKLYLSVQFKKKIMMVVVHYIISKIKLSRIKNFQFQILLLLLKVLVILNVLVQVFIVLNVVVCKLKLKFVVFHAMVQCHIWVKTHQNGVPKYLFKLLNKYKKVKVFQIMNSQVKVLVLLHGVNQIHHQIVLSQKDLFSVLIDV